MIYHSDLQGRIVLILGLGLHGGGENAIKYAHALQAKKILVSDLASKESLHEILHSLRDIEARYEFETHSKSFINQSERIIKNPAISPHSSILSYAIEQKKIIETDISLFLHALCKQHAPTAISMVTGTKGKSSISTALYQLLKKQNKTHNANIELVGNIRNSALAFLMKESKAKHIVCELSAQQSGDLSYVPTLRLQLVQCLVFTNFMRDHLNYYSDIENYFNNKSFIFSAFARHIASPFKHSIASSDKDTQDSTQLEIQKKKRIIIPNDEWGKRIAAMFPENFRLWHSLDILEKNKKGAWLENNRIYYRKNPSEAKTLYQALENTSTESKNAQNHKLSSGFIQNALIILAYCIATNIAFPESLDEIESLLHIEHRKELLDIKEGLQFMNDSAATIPQAMQIASLPYKHVFLICGGTDKNLKAEYMLPECKAAKHCYLLSGTFTDILIPILEKNNITYSGPFSQLKEALDSAIQDAKPYVGNASNIETIITLSPGCASFGMFKHEFDRGMCFKQLIKALSN